jgi:hypothetical protein
VAIGSGLIAEMGIPNLREGLSRDHHHFLQFTELVRPEAPGSSKPDGIQPEFGCSVTLFDMDVRRFQILTTVEEEPKSLEL